jgi:hypothetical protein
MYCLLKKKRQCLFFHCFHTTTINTGFCDLKRCRAFCLPASKQAVLQQWTPGGCPLIQFSCHTIYLELALGPTGSSPQTIPHSTWLIDWLIDWWDQSLNSGFCSCKSGTLPLDPYLQSILLWLFQRWGLWTIFQGWLQTTIFSISASQIARITGMSHWHLAPTPI